MGQCRGGVKALYNEDSAECMLVLDNDVSFKLGNLALCTYVQGILGRVF